MSASPLDSPSSTLPTPQTSVSGSDSASSLMSTTSATSSPSSNPRHTRNATDPGAPELSRRKSVSYDHVRASSLVTTSPFKDPNSKPIGAKYRPTPVARPSPQHSPRRPVSRERKASKTSENKNQDNLKKSRKGQGLQALSKSEVVTRSPFLDGNRPPKSTAEPDADDECETLKLQTKSLQISTEVDPSPRQLPPTPTTPPRLSCHSGVPLTPNTPSPRSNLVSKRFHGPRSPGATPERVGSTKRRRRKTVTFDERCDVLEFDQDEPSEELLSDEEDEDSNDEADPSWDEYPEASPVMSDTVESVVESLLAEEVCGPGTVHTTFHYEPPEPHVNQDEHIQEPDAPEVEEEFVPIRHEPRLFVGEAVFSTSSPQRFRSRQHSPHRESTPSDRPHTIKDEIRRQMEGQKQGSCSSEPFDDTPTYERASIPRTQPLLADLREQSASSVLEDSRTSTTEPETPAIIEDALPTSGPTSGFKHMTTPQAVDLDDCHSALDKLMVGVQRGFDTSYYSIDGRDEGDYETQSADGNLERGSPDDHIVSLPPSASPIRRGSDLGSATTEPEMEEGPFTPPPLDVLPPIPSIADSKPLPIDSPVRHSTMRDLPALPLPEPEWPLLEEHSPIIRTRSPSPNSALGRRNTIKMHAEKIKLRRRQLRAERGDLKSRRRISTGDAKILIAEHNGGSFLPVTVEDQAALGDELELEIAKRFPNVKRSYHLREQPDIIYASDGRVSHLGGVGDVELGLAWRTVRRPSDMYSYTKEIRDARTRAQPGKSHGKVFVKVSGLRDIHIPLPSQPTFFTCVLNNGIHFVETPVVQLARDCLIEQEFELIEHEKLEFTLTIKIRKDPHISAILNPPPPLPVVRAATPSKSSVMRSLFSSPKHKKQASSKEAARSEPVVDPFARYMRQDLTVGRAFISFKDILHRCDTKLFETSYPLIGQIHDERFIGTSGKATMTTPIGEIVLQVFRLPPIPGVPADELPQSLEDCHRGLRHVQWHKKIWHEGGLTQYGGDCVTWRRRHFRVVGASLVAYNDITKKPTAKIDLRKAVQVEDETKSLPSSSGAETSPGTPQVLRRRSSFNALSGIEHSFRVVFSEEEICFYADTAEEKRRWLEVFGALIGKVPPKPLWAEMLWQQQSGEEATVRG